MRRHDDDSEFVCVLTLGEVLEELEPTHPRHHQVEKNQTRARQRIELAERVEAIRGRGDLPPPLAEHLRKRLTDVPVVVDDQDAGQSIVHRKWPANSAFGLASASDARCAPGAQERGKLVKSCG